MSQKEDVRLYYDKVGPELFKVEDKNIHLKSRMTIVLELIDKYAKSKGECLDLGCGSGYLLYRLAEREFECTGIDLSPKFLALARRRLAKLSNCEVKLIEGDIHKVDLPDGKFDLVTATDVLEHVEHPDIVMSEIYRLLRGGGISIVSVPNWWNIYGLGRLVYEKVLRQKWRVPTDNWFNPKTLRQLALRNNLSILELRGTYFLPLTKSLPYQDKWYDNRYSRFESLLSRTFISYTGLYLIAALYKKRVLEGERGI